MRSPASVIFSRQLDELEIALRGELLGVQRGADQPEIGGEHPAAAVVLPGGHQAGVVADQVVALAIQPGGAQRRSGQLSGTSTVARHMGLGPLSGPQGRGLGPGCRRWDISWSGRPGDLWRKTCCRSRGKRTKSWFGLPKSVVRKPQVG